MSTSSDRIFLSRSSRCSSAKNTSAQALRGLEGRRLRQLSCRIASTLHSLSRLSRRLVQRRLTDSKVAGVRVSVKDSTATRASSGKALSETSQRPPAECEMVASKSAATVWSVAEEESR